jgi:phage/plasmid-like protein (TIGR03299 family)
VTTVGIDPSITGETGIVMQEGDVVDTKNVQFSEREVPWMKLGKLVDGVKTSAEAAKLGGIDFDVIAYDAAWHTGTEIYKVPSRKALVRGDTNAFIDYVSESDYTIIQYREAFEFMDTINPEYVAAGALRGGRQGFMVVKVPDVFDIKVLGGEDPHDLYAVFRTSHDRSRGAEVMMMPLRNRCMNQLTLSTFKKDVKNRWSIKHTSTAKAKLAEAQMSIMNMKQYADRMNELVTKMVNVNLTAGEAEKMIKIVIPKPAHSKTEAGETSWQNRIGQIINLWQESPTVGYAGTGWGLVNAVSEYHDWTRKGGTPESRFLNALEGTTHKTLNRTAQLVLQKA